MKNGTIFSANWGVETHCYSYLFIILTASFLLASTWVSCSSKAQSRRQNPETKIVKPADHIILEMKIDLNLSDEQELKIRPIIEEQVRKRKELIQKFQDQGRPSLESLRAELKDLRISTERQLQYFLTNEQMIKYGNMQQEEDQRITSEKPKEQEGQKMRKGRGHRSRDSLN